MLRKLWNHLTKPASATALSSPKNLKNPAAISVGPGSEDVAGLMGQFQQELQEILAEHPYRTTLLDVYFAYRLILGRPPESAQICRHHSRTDLKALAATMLDSSEFRLTNPGGILRPPEIPVMAELSNGLRFYFYLSDRYVGWNMAVEDYDPPQAKVIAACLEAGSHCVDLGANIGPFTLQMAAQVGPSGAVYAFEPFPKNFRLLQRNIEINGMHGWVKAFPYAVHSAPGKIRLFFDYTTQSDYWAVFASTQEQPPSFDSIEVEQVRLDDIIPEGEKIDFIKMDIEGSELAAVQGMRRILTTWRPRMAFEFNPRMLRSGGGADAGALLEDLRAIGYRIVPVEGYLAGKLAEFEYDPSCDDGLVVNLVAVP